MTVWYKGRDVLDLDVESWLTPVCGTRTPSTDALK